MSRRTYAAATSAAVAATKKRDSSSQEIMRMYKVAAAAAAAARCCCTSARSRLYTKKRMQDALPLTGITVRTRAHSAKPPKPQPILPLNVNLRLDQWHTRMRELQVQGPYRFKKTRRGKPPRYSHVDLLHAVSSCSTSLQDQRSPVHIAAQATEHAIEACTR